jgi:hypothetical protein
MNVSSFAKQYADQIGGQFTEYDETKSIIVVPLTDGRFQTVLLFIEKNKASGKPRAVLTSKVGEYNETINLKDLLEATAQFDYSRFILDGQHLKVEASFSSENALEDEVKHMIQEVAQVADLYELKLTGKDIH